MSQQKIIADRFEIGDFIAQGGMGAVYGGRDLQTGQPVAIKLLRPELVAENPDMIARFMREGEALRRLDHPNIVKMLAAFPEGDAHYLVMEYVGGGSLRDLLRPPSRLSVAHAVKIALELADALSRAHHLKIIHRDIKPDNVLLADDGTPRLTDFGVARVGDLNLTSPTVVVGTLAYLSPEALSGMTLDDRTDIWAFGVMLYEMLAGCCPFGGEHVGAITGAILHKPTPNLTTIRPDVPVALVDLINRMLEKDRDRRIPSVRQIGAELESILKSMDMTPSEHRPAPNVEGPTVVVPTPPKSNRTPPNVSTPSEPLADQRRESEVHMESIRVLVVDDHPMFRNGLHGLLSSLPDFEWVGEGREGAEAVELALRLQPDVILMDIQMPGLNGIEATRQILQHSPHIGVLILTMYENDDLVFSAMQTGARGYLLKGADQGEIARAIQAVANGEAIFSPGIAKRIKEIIAAPKVATHPPGIFPELTEREREILDLVAAGHDNAEIARQLVLSSKTVRNHVSNIFSKLQVHTRAEAIVRTLQAGLGQTDNHSHDPSRRASPLL